jgi:Holliday junction resolvasome RuvABC endonuclease subunit
MILGISPGTSRFGFAVIRNKELIHWGTKSYKGKWDGQKLKRIIKTLEQLIVEYGITQVAMKYPDHPPVAKEYNQLIGSLNVFIESKFLTLNYYHLKQVKRYFGKGNVVSKRDVFELIKQEYPEIEKRKRSMFLYNFHYAKLLEATAVAHVHLNTESPLIHK